MPKSVESGVRVLRHDVVMSDEADSVGADGADGQVEVGEPGDPARLWPSSAEQSIGHLPRPGHQGPTGHTAGNGRLVQGPDLRGGVEGIGQGVAGRQGA